jgi:hypothetical protein
MTILVPSDARRSLSPHTTYCFKSHQICCYKISGLFPLSFLFVLFFYFVILLFYFCFCDIVDLFKNRKKQCLKFQNGFNDVMLSAHWLATAIVNQKLFT